MAFPIRDPERDEEHRLVEWTEWRGRIGAQVEGNTAQIGEMARRITAGFDRQELNFDRRMDKQDIALSEIVQQARATNGRVTALEAERRTMRRVLTALSGIAAAFVSGGGIYLVVHLH